MLLEKLFGGSVVSAAAGVADIVDQFIETPGEKRVAEQLRMRLALRPHLAQIGVNKIEAGHRSIFVAGWRPFIGWVCGGALLWHFILFDALSWALLGFAPAAPPPPVLTGTDQLISIVIALLGLGGLRTLEKRMGKAK